VACGDRMVYIITPGPRYHGIPCCCSGDHCTHLQMPESGIKLMQDLARLHLFISRRLSSSSNCSVLPACDLLTGRSNASPEEALVAFSSWGAVHGSSSNYTRMALCLVDNHFRKMPVAAMATAQPPLPAPPTKRPRADSSSSYESGLESGMPIPVLSSFRFTPRFKAASCPSLASPGAAPEAANEAAAPLPPREAPAAVRGPPVAEAAEPTIGVRIHNSCRPFFVIVKIIF
jgi:hypothetical protein